ncbi:UNVERIFIED_CONTAM: hypothetical protein NCL1_20113 [Trichonephila clavipes]
MHFAIETLFYEENHEMFKVPGKSSLDRKIRNMEVRYIEVRLLMNDTWKLRFISEEMHEENIFTIKEVKHF